jgi:hypothetical protein
MRGGVTNNFENVLCEFAQIISFSGEFFLVEVGKWCFVS